MFIDVAIPVNIENLFTYSVPKEYEDIVQIGQRVVVSFGKSKIYTAIIINIHNNKPDKYIVKPIIDILEADPSITKIQIDFFKWISKYYMCSLGEVINASLPSGLKIESETKIYINDLITNPLIEKNELFFYNNIKKKGIDKLENVIKKNGAKSIKYIKSLLEKGLVTVYEEIKQKYKPKYEKYIIINPNLKQEFFLKETLNKMNNAPKQKEVLFKLLSIPKEEISFSEITRMDNSYSQILHKLDEKNIIEIFEHQVSRFKNEIQILKTNLLSDFQEKSLHEIEKSFESKNISLLFGVTSSGKTEIYIKIIEKIISKNKQVLFLLPEIALTTQIIQRLKKNFGEKVGVYHSRYNSNQKTEIWNKVLKGDLNVIVGARSSIFLPFKNLEFIIIDEEHDSSYKQKDINPKYNAKSCALILARILNIKVLLGSATPSIETYNKALNKDYGLIKLEKRYLDIKLPEIKIIDIRPYYKKKKMNGHFSPDLISEINTALKEKNQIILFQNRRGYSPYIECIDCGNIPKCKKCDVSLTYHKKQNILKCHYCGYIEINHKKCVACGNTYMQEVGFGTEKIEEEINIIFPNTKSIRMDIDTTSRKNSFLEIIEKFENREVDILIGTQMITKGLNFDNVSLVGVLNADNLLSYPDFRAYEKGFQILTQVSGRAGRKYKQGKVIIQTSNPENEIIKYVYNNSFEEMYQSQINERELFLYPPYTRIIDIYLKYKDYKILNDGSNIIADSFKNIFKENFLGPVSPVISRINNLYIKKMTIKFPINSNINYYKNIIKEIKDNFLSTKVYRNIIFTIDVDPL